MPTDDLNPVQLVMKHPGALIPGLYLLGSTIGMLDSWWFYRHFGIDVFLYSDISDYLLASFREPFSWAIVAFSLLIAVADHSTSLRVERSSRTPRWLRWYGTRRYRQSGWVTVAVIVAAYILLFAGFRAGFYLDGQGTEIEVSLSDDTNARAVLLGGTINFLFLYDADEDQASIYPYDNVVSVRSTTPN